MDQDKKLEKEIKAGFGFDPDWDTQQAMEAGHDGPFSPFHRWDAWNRLSEYKAAYEEGNKEVLFSALRNCAAHNLPMPNWLADAYCMGHDLWLSYRKPTLDEAFDVKPPKGTHINKLKELRTLKVAIPLFVRKLQETGRAIDPHLFEDVGKEFGVSGSKARDIYYKYNPLSGLQKKR